MASLTHAASRTTSMNAPAAARNALAFAARSPASFSSRRALSSNTRSLLQFPRLQSIQSISNKRAFGTTVRMVSVQSFPDA
jgi:fumarate hydratase class II